MSKQQQ